LLGKELFGGVRSKMSFAMLSNAWLGYCS